MPKPVARHVLDTRAANKIMNILEGESAGTKQRILNFVQSSIFEQEGKEKQDAYDAQMASYRQPPLSTLAVPGS